MNYLINESPLVLLPTLAEVIGLNEALVLQQMQYWLSRSDKVIDGRKWIYNSYEEWEKQFPFWSNSTIKRTILNLESRGIVISANHNKAKFDKTKWYTIDYSKLTNECVKLTQSKSVSNLPTPCVNLNQPIPDTTTDNTTDTTSDINNNAERSSTIPYAEIIDYLNERLGTKYRSTSKATQSLIRARFKDKFTVEDFKMVIDKKIFHWQGTKWSVYLRPKTLFGPNFESYLNEQVRGYDNAKLITTNGEYDSSGRKLL